MYSIRAAELQDAGKRDLYTRFLQGVVMGLEFDHPQGAKLVMRRLYENGVWAIFSTLDPRVLQFKPGILIGPELVDEILDRTAVAIGQAVRDVAVTA